MINELDIPDEIFGAFQQLRRHMPLEMRDDENLLKKIRLYLKFGGAKLARHGLSLHLKGFPEEFVLAKWQSVEGDSEADTEADTESGESDESGDTETA
jgi:hypothetical protein